MPRENELDQGAGLAPKPTPKPEPKLRRPKKKARSSINRAQQKQLDLLMKEPKE